MDHRDHVELLRAGVATAGPGASVGGGGRWADLGSGAGAFTLALADLLGPTGEIWSVDRDRAALAEQRNEFGSRFPSARVTWAVADFTRDLDLPPLDGIVMANSLHFERDQGAVLERDVRHLVPGGRLILVEYDADQGNRWVPYPISARRWVALAAAAGLINVREIGRRRSRFLGSIYSAVGEVPATTQADTAPAIPEHAAHSPMRTGLRP